MKLLMWVLIAGVAAVSVLIGCYPAAHSTLIAPARIQSWPPDYRTPLRLCDDKGICCYLMPSEGSLSCVATKVIISSGEIEDENIKPEGQGRLLLDSRVSSDTVEPWIAR